MKLSITIILLLLAMQMFSLSFGMMQEEEPEGPSDPGAMWGAVKGAVTVARTIGGTILAPFAKSVRGYVRRKLGHKGVQDMEGLVVKAHKTGQLLREVHTAKQRKDVLFLPFYYAFTVYTSLTFGVSLYLFFPFSMRHLKVLFISMASIYLYMKYYTYDTPCATFLAIEYNMWCIIMPFVFAAMLLFLGVTMKLLNFIVIFGAPSLVAILVALKGCTNLLDGSSEVSKARGGRIYAGGRTSVEIDAEVYKPFGKAAARDDEDH